MKQRDDENDFPNEHAETPAAGEELPPITTLHVDCTDKRGIHYQGAFIFKVPTLRDEIEIARQKSLLLPVSVVNDVNGVMLAEMIAYLSVTIQKGDKGERLPKWWKPLEFYDVTPVVMLYAEATAYGKRFRGESNADDRANEGEAADEHADDGGGAVDGNVPPPVERRTIHRTDAARSASTSASRRSSESGEG